MLLERLTFCNWRASAALAMELKAPILLSSKNLFTREDQHYTIPVQAWGHGVTTDQTKIEVCFDNSGAISHPLTLES